jgi:hypothetical protein
MQKIAEYSAKHDAVYASADALKKEAQKVHRDLEDLTRDRDALIAMTVDDPPLPSINMGTLSVDNVTAGATSSLGDAAAATSTHAVDLVVEFEKAHDKVVEDTTDLKRRSTRFAWNAARSSA